MNTLKQIASRAIVFVLALSILVPALVMSGDNNVVQAEKLATLYLTNKGTAKTTEVSPPASRTAPASRVNASTVYATMTDVDTGNTPQNSHIVDANKVVITVVEDDFNSKIAVDSDVNARATKVTVNATSTFLGSPGDPVIDTDNDGDLTDEINVLTLTNDATTGGGESEDNTDAKVNWNGTAWVSTTGSFEAADGNPDAEVDAVWNVVSVANSTSATTSTVAPAVTLYLVDDDLSGNGEAHANNDDIFLGYYSSAVNTFQVSAWSTVQLESNASVISVVETGRNTGVFEAEFLIADTEGANDSVGAIESLYTSAGAVSDSQCGTNGTTAAPGTSLTDGRWDRSGGINADCEMKITVDLDIGAADPADTAAGGALAANLAVGTLAPGESIVDTDADGSILDEIYFGAGSATAIAGNNIGRANDTGKIQITSITCGGTLAKCTDGTGGAILIVSATAGAAFDGDGGDATDLATAIVPIMDNVVNNRKIDSDLNGTIVQSGAGVDSLSSRVGMDTLSSANYAGTGSIIGTFAHGRERTPIVEAQANSVITVQYQDLTDSNSSTTATAGTKVKATVSIDVDAPTPIVSTPSNGSSFKDRQPSFSGSATDIGSGLDVSTVTLYVDVLDDGADTAATLDAFTAGQGAWLGGAGSIDLQEEYRATAGTLDNTTTMIDGVTSVTWTVTTSTNIPCLTVADDNVSAVSTGASGHTNFAQAALLCTGAKDTPDVSLDYFSSATDIAGNRGFSDAIPTDTNDGTSLKDNYSFNIDEKKPELDPANTETGVYWNAATTAEKTGDTTRIVVAFDDEISDAPASSFEITTDAGTVLTPVSTEIGTTGTTAAGASYDKRKDVYLTLGTSLASSETPKVKLVGNISDLAGNANKSGNVPNAIDKIKPSLTLALSGGSGTGSSPDDTLGLTKKSMTFTITTSEVLSGVPTVSIFSEDYGTGATYGALGDNLDLTTTAAGSSKTLTIGTMTVVDTDKDGSLLDEVVLEASTAEPPSADVLVNLEITSVTNSSDDVVVIVKNNNSAALAGGGDEVKISGNINAAYTAASPQVSAEGTVTAVAVDATTYTATFNGSLAGFSDAAAKDSKAVVLSASDVNANTGTLGTRDQGASSVYKFRLDKTAPVLKNDPDGDGTVGSSTTLPRPYVIFEFTDNTKVDVKSASFGGDDVLAKLATTNSKKYFMVPESDLAANTYAIKAKGTDLAGNAGSEGNYNLKVTSRKDYKATILAGWNLMSFPSDPIASDVSAVYTNAGIDQVVGYDAMSKGSPWAVATKDTATGLFSGGLTSISSGNGYWVHSTEFSSQAVSLTGPEGPSASAPPSIEAISLASGWNLVGITDATKALTQANAGTVYKGVEDYLGAAGGSSVTKAFTYNTTNLAWSAKDLTALGGDVSIGEAYWVFAKPDANGMLTPIVP